jgi:hypothetical protein
VDFSQEKSRFMNSPVNSAAVVAMVNLPHKQVRPGLACLGPVMTNL